jgi:hypothetical protein
MLGTTNVKTKPTIASEVAGDWRSWGWWRALQGVRGAIADAVAVAGVERDEVGPSRGSPVFLVDNPELVVIGHVGA